MPANIYAFLLKSVHIYRHSTNSRTSMFEKKPYRCKVSETILNSNRKFKKIFCERKTTGALFIDEANRSNLRHFFYAFRMNTSFEIVRHT